MVMDVKLSCCCCLQLILNNRFKLGFLLSKYTSVLFHELLMSSYLHHCVYSEVTADNSLQTVWL